MCLIKSNGKAYKTCSWIWQLPQNLLALIIRKCIKKKIMREYNIDNDKVIVNVAFPSSMTLGNYIFASPYETIVDNETIEHELGHCRQSRFLGPLYLIVIGLPSIIHNEIHYLCAKEGIHWDYYKFYTERWLMKK